MIRIKICGITEVEHALAASQFGANFIGLVFAPSRRMASLEKAEQITAAVRQLKPRPQIVGVFVNEDIQRLNQIADCLCLDWVQLSGTEPLDYCKLVSRPIIRTIHVSPDDTADNIIKVIKTGYDSLPRDKLLHLLDTKMEGHYGGTGRTFDWTVARKIALQFPIIVAGGLTADNVAVLVSRVKPFGIDVSSGVETAGKKDVAKIASFIQAVKNAEASSQTNSVSWPNKGGSCSDTQ